MCLRYTLLSDGPSDRCLLSILDWELRELSDDVFQSNWFDPRNLSLPSRQLRDRIATCLSIFPCELLFIHRDAEKELRDRRVQEIQQGIQEAQITVPPAICVIPVRMTEAWLLFDEGAIRRAAGNPNGALSLCLPPMSQIESLPDPKHRLQELLQRASELSGRRLKNFRPSAHVYRLAQQLADFSPLRALTAFQAFEDELSLVLKEKGWLKTGIE